MSLRIFFKDKNEVQVSLILAAAGNLEPSLPCQNVNCVTSIDCRNPCCLILVWCSMNVVFSTLFGNVLRSWPLSMCYYLCVWVVKGAPDIVHFTVDRKTFPRTPLEHFYIKWHLGDWLVEAEKIKVVALIFNWAFNLELFVLMIFVLATRELCQFVKRVTKGALYYFT